MDHAITALKPYYYYELDSVAQELSTGQYKCLRDCPSHKAARALRRALNELEVYYYGKKLTEPIEVSMAFQGLMRGKVVIVCSCG